MSIKNVITNNKHQTHEIHIHHFHDNNKSNPSTIHQTIQNPMNELFKTL